MRLDQLKKGNTGTITAVRGEAGLRRRLLDLGLTPNTVIMVRKSAPLGDPIVVSLRGFELSLRKMEASRVEITPFEQIPTPHGNPDSDDVRIRNKKGKGHTHGN